jgi:hypothetical protein
MTEESLTPTEFDFMSKPAAKEEETVWCKISPEGGLELFDWEFVEKTAREFDALGQVAQKSNAHIICKLAVLIREQTLHRAAEALKRYAEVSAEASVVMLKDPLELEE